MATENLDSATDASALDLLLERGWGLEVLHQLILKELFDQSNLGRELGIWSLDAPPDVLYEPFRGLFDLALRGDGPDVLIELKGATEVGEGQRSRQLAFAEAAGARRVYILLGVGYWAITREAGPTYIGLPDLAEAVRRTVPTLTGPLRELADAYLRRLEDSAATWTQNLGAEGGAITILRLYADIAAAWPVEVRPWRATNRSGPEWILDADAWTKPDVTGWAGAELYWELVNGRTRFKVKWSGDPARAMMVRRVYQQSLLDAAAATGVDIRPTRAKRGRWMTAAEFEGNAADDVVIDGRVDPTAARALYDRATATFRAAIARLPPLG